MDHKFDIKFTKLFIDRNWVDSKHGKYYDVYSPIFDKVLVKVVEGDKYDVDFAVDAARRALKYDSDWRLMDKTYRGRLLYKLADLLKRDMEYLIWLEVMNTGRTYQDVMYDVKQAIKILRYYGGYTDKIFGRTMLDTTDDIEFTRKEPIGVVGLIGNHHMPLVTFIRKIAPVLVTGSTLVYKPSFKTPLSTLYLAHLIDEVGFPKGVVNVITGRGTVVGEAIGLHDLIKHVTFTGHKDIGRLYLDYATKSNMKIIRLHLDDRSPLIVLKDADIDDAVMIAHHAAFFRDGLTRFRVGRIFVHDDIYDKFVKRSIDLVRKRMLGDVFDRNVRVGSLINEYHFKKFMDYIDLAKKDGAKVDFGGKRFGTTGFIVEPTILTDVRDDMKILKEDVYGPVKLITRFKRLDDIFDWTKTTKYGLGAGIITKDFEKLMHLTRRFDTGLVWINTWHDLKPYLTYGGRNLSGYGDYLGRDIIHDYLVTKTVHGLLDTKKFATKLEKYIRF